MLKMTTAKTIRNACVLLFALLPIAKTAFAQEIVKINTTESDSGVSITAKNSSPSPAVLRFTSTGQNIESSCLHGCILDIASNQEITIDQINPVNSKTSWQYGIEYSSQLGKIVTHHDWDYVYWPAFKHGEKYYLSQGFNGSFSHQGINAIDFSMPEGSPVHAARGGQVLWVEQSFKTGGFKAIFKNKANYISIQHADGTQATYAHLMFNGALVKPGDHVVKGSHIGFSGKTGYAKGPHLHFEVSRITPAGELESLPFKIRSRHGVSAYPKIGYYYAIDDTKPSVKEVYADEIDFDRYFNSDRSVSVTTVKDRQYTLDDHLLIYIQNGKLKSIEVELTISLQGYEIVRAIPAKLHIKPGTEKLIAVIRPSAGAQSPGVSYSYKYRELH